ncbi:tubulin-binding protein [Pasteurellaceae bacterium Orientalotternb1]|nr:tubulin-binding protein [Pasteurellaceae bacterium Orientalotternb1]
MEHQKTEQQITETQSTETSHPPKKRRWLRWGLALLLLVIAVPIAFLSTGKGQQLALQWVAKAVDGLSFSKVEGSLQDGLTLSDTAFKMDGVDVQVGQADLHLGFGCLLERKACVENVAVKNAHIQIDTSKLPPSNPKQERKTGEFSLPLPIELKQLALDNVQVNVDEMAILLDHFHSGLAGEGKNLHLSPTELRGLTLRLPSKNAEQAVSSEQKFANPPIDWAALKQQLSQPRLTKLEPIKLPLNLTVNDLQAQNIHIEQQTRNEKGEKGEPQSLVKVSSVALVGKSDEQSIELKTLNIQTDKGNVTGQGLLTLDGNYPLAWQLNAETPDLAEFKLPASQVDLNLSGELFGTTALAVKTQGAVKADIQGSVQLAEPKTPLNLTVKSDEVRYPFIGEKGEEPLKLKKLDFALEGDLLNYQLNGSVAISGMGLPAGDIAVKGKGELTQFELEQLALNALQGKVNLTGKVDWSNGVEWNAKANLDGINTKSLTPEWAALLSGDLQSTGFAGRGKQAEQWGVAVSEMNLFGTIANKKLQLKGELTANNQTLLTVPQANLIYGENNITLKGVLGEQSDFSADINAPNLQGLVPNLKASLKGKVRLQGKVTEPSLDLDLTGNNISYAETQLQQVIAKGKITAEKMVQGDLDIAIKQFRHGEIKIEQANLTVSGSEANHNLKLTSKGDPVGANLQISGKFDRVQQRWQGLLSNVAMSSPVGEWKNDKAVQITYDNKQINADISAHCWRNPKLNLCFPQAFSAGKEGKVPFEIKSFDLAAIQEFLPKESQLSGNLSAKGDAAWFTNKSPVVNVEVNSNGIKLVQKIDYRTLPISLKPLSIKANLAENNLKLNTDIRLENNGRLVSELLMKDIAKTRALSGNLNLERINLSVISPLLSSGESVDGELNARLTFGGNALSPQLFGNLNLTGLKVKAYMMPFDVTGGNLALNFNGASSTLKGNIQTKESNLVLEGDANWQKLEAWHTRVSAQANRFRIDIPGIAKVDVSPNIEVKATPNALLLSGNVDIPWARIAVEELPESAVSISDDEVIMDGSAKHKQKIPLPTTLPSQNSKGMAIKADILVNIGNDRVERVSLDAYGLKTDIYGILKVRQGDKGLGLYGQVNLKNGTFASFGQDLVIRKGLISFSGLPSQPTLDIEAIRNPEAMEDPSIVAGVKVTGIADSPDVKVFSTPAMAQDQALSYVLTGRSLESSGDGSSSNSIAAALIGLSLSKSSKLVGGVGSAFGITDLNVTTAGIGDNTKVEVSGSLTPKFKVKYAVGIFAPLTELTLRYRLAPSLYLQWMSSVNQAVDLFYRFEFD